MVGKQAPSLGLKFWPKKLNGSGIANLGGYAHSFYEWHLLNCLHQRKFK